MSDYYKINTVGLPKCTKSTLLFTHSNYECNYFCKIIILCLTWWWQIDYLLSSSNQNSIEGQLTKKQGQRTTQDFFLEFYRCSLGKKKLIS